MERMKVSDVEQIYALLNEYADSVSTGEKERWIGLWLEDGLQMTPDTAQRDRKELIRTEHQPLFDSHQASMAIYPDEIEVLGGHAYSHGLYEFAMTDREGAKRIEGQGRFLMVLTKQTDGTWKIVNDCFNYDPLLMRYTAGDEK